jgi:hypothetical protein
VVEQNPDEARRGSAGEGLGGSLWATRVLFGHWVGGERWPVSGAPAAREGRPRWLLFPASWGSVSPVDESASYGRVRGW